MVLSASLFSDMKCRCTNCWTSSSIYLPIVDIWRLPHIRFKCLKQYFVVCGNKANEDSWPCIMYFSCTVVFVASVIWWEVHCSRWCDSYLGDGYTQWNWVSASKPVYRLCRWLYIPPEILATESPSFWLASTRYEGKWWVITSGWLSWQSWCVFWCWFLFIHLPHPDFIALEEALQWSDEMVLHLNML